MSTSRYPFRLPDGLASDNLLTAVEARFRLKEEPQASLLQTYYDSFDWRLYLGGAILRQETEGRERRIVWTALDDANPWEIVRHQGSMPRFAWDFPVGRMRTDLTPLLEMRALLPQVDVRIQRRLFRILDGEEKTVLRLALENYQSRTPGKGEFQSLSGRVRLLPVRGYLKPLASMQDLLEAEVALESVCTRLLDEALAAIGHEAADYTSKMDFRFQPQMPAGDVTREIHLHLLDTVERNIPGTRADLDSEFLHDLRVATRRTRSALTQVKGVFSDEALENFKPRLAWIGQITGPTRDMDVYLLDFDSYQQSLPEQFREDLEPLREFLLSHQKSEHKKMVKKINSPHFRILLKEWRAFLEIPSGEGEVALNADRPVREVANKRIYRVYRRVLAEGLAINDSSPPEAFHELRKNCKKLRYLVEFFQSLYPKNRVRPLIKTLKELLNNLGDYQDAEVQALKLREFAQQMGLEGKVPVYTLLAMGMLVDGLLKKQQTAHDQFADRFSGFSGSENRNNFKQLFAPGRQGEKQ